MRKLRYLIDMASYACFIATFMPIALAVDLLRCIVTGYPPADYWPVAREALSDCWLQCKEKAWGRSASWKLFFSWD
jgi:hypothetical protein